VTGDEIAATVRRVLADVAPDVDVEALRDYPVIATLDGCVAYLRARLADQAP
jgi:hypothetical protein